MWRWCAVITSAATTLGCRLYPHITRRTEERPGAGGGRGPGRVGRQPIREDPKVGKLLSLEFLDEWDVLIIYKLDHGDGDR